MQDYEVTVTGPPGVGSDWEAHLDTLNASLIGWPEGPPMLSFTVSADGPMEALVTGVARIRDVGILGETALSAEPSAA